MLIINADDWGASRATTDTAAECFRHGRISAATAMVFMEDTERSAQLASDIGIDVGLHLNVTEPFRDDCTPPEVQQAQNQVASFLARKRLAPFLFNPLMHRAFALTVAAQLDEYRRVFGREPSHIDGHHHQHLCANVLYGGLLPAGFIVRRHYTFFTGEKSLANRGYRRFGNWVLSHRCRMLDGFFDLTQYMAGDRLERLSTLSQAGVVELMVHPAEGYEFDFLLCKTFGTWLEQVELTDFRAVDAQIRR